MRLKSVHFSRQVRFPHGGKMYSHLDAAKAKCVLTFVERFRCVQVRLDGASEDTYVPMEAIDSFVTDEPVVAVREQESSRKSTTR